MSFPYQTIDVPGASALEVFWNLKREGRTQGFTPVIVGAGRDMELVSENFEVNGESIEDALSQFSTRANSAVEVFQRLRGEYEGDLDEPYDDGFHTVSVADVPDATSPKMGITSHLDISNRKPLASVRIAKIPTLETWLVPIYLKCGGWNACPEAVDHAVVAKYWFDKYGAEIVAATGSVMEFEVARPAATKEAALELAKEQYVYCGDIVDQGVGDIQSLAATVLDDKNWYFWWD